MLGLILILSVPAVAQLLPPRQNAAGENADVFLPAPRGLRQQLERAQQALAEERYSEAVDLLGQLLAPNPNGADPSGETVEQDFFLTRPGRPGGTIGQTRQSLKSEALRLIGSMPEKGRALYELKYGADARQLLDRAVQARDIQQMVEVSRRYFHTDAGYEATMLIGRHYLDRGRPLAAALAFQRLESSEYATRQYDPELSVLLSTCWLLSSMTDRAQEVLVGLESRLPQAQLRIGRHVVSLFDKNDKTIVEALRRSGDDRASPATQDSPLLSFLTDVIGPQVARGKHQATEWTVYRGDPSRNAESLAGTPLATARWRVQTANHPRDEKVIKQGQSQFREQGLPVLPTLNPLAVDDVIVMRTPRRVMGVDFHSGKRIWEFPWLETEAEEEIEDERLQALEAQSFESDLNRRIWDDAPYGQMSSNGKQVFVLWGLSANSAPSVLVQRFGIQAANQNASVTTNKLVALDLAAQGKLRWIVGDEDGTDEPDLAGAFFLGAPLPLMGQLFALAEINGEIRLVVLNEMTGRLEWSQQLAHVDARTITSDPGRRAAGATPSFSDGLLVCPTSTGAVVAVDVANRSLLWGYQYPLVGQSRRIGMARYRFTPMPIGERWADASVTISHGRVVVTPVESDRLFCLDLVSGQPVWEPLKREDRLFTACIYQDNAIVVGKGAVEAISLEDRRRLWKIELPSGLPSGRGVLSANYYYMPTSSNKLLKIDLAEGKIVQQAETDTTLGNLIAYQDQIISQNVDWLSTYYQSEPLRKIVAERLSQNPDDGWALARNAEILLHDGKHHEALEVFQRAYQLNPSDDSIRASLVRSFLNALQDDFAKHQPLASDLESLVTQPDELRRYCRSMAVGLQQQDDYERSVDFLIRLASLGDQSEFGSDDTDSAMVPIEGTLKVDHDRWLRMQFEQITAAAAADVHDSIDAKVRAHLNDVLQSKSLNQLNLFVEHFGSHATHIEARLQLVDMFLGRGEALLAERQLLLLQRANDPATAAGATARLAQLLIDFEKYEEAAQCIERLTVEWPNVAITLEESSWEGSSFAAQFNGLTANNSITGTEIAAALRANSAMRLWLETDQSWYRGKCEVARQDRRSLTAYARAFPIQLDHAEGPAPRFQSVIYDQNQNSLLIHDGRGGTIKTARLDGQERFVTAASVAGSGSALGHLIAMNVGFRAIAIDTLDRTEDAASQNKEKRDKAILWGRDLSSSMLISPQQSPQLMPRTINRGWGPARYVLSDAARHPIGMVGPITQLGLVYQKMSELTCVDPYTGKPIWVRNGFEPGSDIFGDEQYTFVVGPDAQNAQVLRTADGHLLGERPVTSRTERWITFGRNVVTCRSNGQQLLVRCFDAWEQRELWTRSLSEETQCWRPELDTIAFFNAAGELLIQDLASGEPRIECSLAPQLKLSRLYVLASPDRYTVIANGRRPNAATTTISGYGTIGTDQCPEINGHVYSLDRATGTPLWTRAAIVYGYCLPLDQPAESPALVFLRNTRSRSTTEIQQTTFKGAVLCLDRRDGRELYQATDLNRIHNYSITANLRQQAVLVRTNDNEFLLRFSETPVEPALPLQMEGDETVKKRALRSVGKIAGAILDVITEKSDPKEANEIEEEEEEEEDEPQLLPEAEEKE